MRFSSKLPHGSVFVLLFPGPADIFPLSSCRVVFRVRPGSVTEGELEDFPQNTLTVPKRCLPAAIPHQHTHTHSLPRLHGRNCDDVTPNSSRKYREIPFSTVSPRRCRVCRVWVSVGDSLRSQIKNVFTDNKRFYLTEIQWNRLCIRGTNTVLTEMI